ncbi:MAG: cation:proton antiporter, partial [Thioalkalispiraceae bacterium]
MELLNAAAVLITLAAVFGFINARFFKLPTTIGIMLISLVCSLALIITEKLGLADVSSPARQLLQSIDFHETLMQGMLSFLLFAGALHVNLEDLARQKWVIVILATFGVITSTFLIGSLSWFVLDALGLTIPYIYALLFGALISPTDPIAVMGILKQAGVSKSLETKIVGESLFNDGVGVVVFLVLLGIASSGQTPTPASIGLLFAHEALGGMVFGLVTGWLAFWMLKNLNNYQVEILITLSLVM